MKDPACIFCKIANGDIPSKKIYEDEEFVAILDLAPATKGHTLVIPKEHYPDLFAMDEQTASAAMLRARRVAGLLKEKLSPDGMNMTQNNGEVAGQTVLHYHIHLIPRYLSDPEHINWKPAPAEPEVLQSVFSEITGG
ncbi:MAG: HIT family protein [Lachnospiraceae bacterium]|nr:HIT family protein [Lachnospiraceae bacterium]